MIQTYTGPFSFSSGLSGVLNSGGLLVGSAFTLVMAGVDRLFRLLEFDLLAELTRGVLGTSPSRLYLLQHMSLRRGFAAYTP